MVSLAEKGTGIMKTARVLVLLILLASLAPLVSSPPHPAEAGRSARSKRIAEKPNPSADVRRVSDRKTPGSRSNYRFQIKSNISDRSLDSSDDGMRILSATPLCKGMSGSAVKLLPHGAPINRPCIVSWARPSARNGPYEIGLRFL